MIGKKPIRKMLQRALQLGVSGAAFFRAVHP